MYSVLMIVLLFSISYLVFWIDDGTVFWLVGPLCIDMVTVVGVTFVYGVDSISVRLACILVPFILLWMRLFLYRLVGKLKKG